MILLIATLGSRIWSSFDIRRSSLYDPLKAHGRSLMSLTTPFRGEPIDWLRKPRVKIIPTSTRLGTSGRIIIIEGWNYMGYPTN